MRLFLRTPLLVAGLAPLALAGAVAGPAAGASADTACTAWNGAQPVNPEPITQLDGVAVVSSCDVWAVGSSLPTSSSPPQALFEHWTGSSWARVNSTVFAFLNDVSAASASDIWAVGSGPGTMIVHYDGTGWTQTPSPHSDDGSLLFTVDARTANDAWAGGFINEAGGQGLMLHWDGTNWTTSDLPPTVDIGGTKIFSVSADSATDAWALAQLTTGNSAFVHWDGSQWTASTVTGPHSAYLNSVTALSPTNAWAVGRFTSGLEKQTLIEHWDGTSWNVVPSPNPGGTGQDNELMDVTATSASDIWATGSYITSSTTATAFALHWDGTAWTTVTLPGSGIQSTDANHESISATAAGQAWVAGWGGLHGSGPTPFAMPVPVVPDVTGQQAGAASSTVTAAGLTGTQIQTTGCPPSAFGEVVNQNPFPGHLLTLGQAVTLTVCAALVTVPDVTGDDDASARNAITSAGLRVGTVTLTPDCTNPRGTVLSQSPDGGTKVQSGSSVSLNEATRSGRATHQIAPRFCTQ